MVTREDVIYAYRFLLGREPNPGERIEQHCAAADWRNLRERIVGSLEYQRNLGSRQSSLARSENLLAAPNPVDVIVSGEHLATLLDRTRVAWEALGAETPHWSVIPNPMYRPNEIGSNLDRFYASGARSWQFLERAAARGEKVLSRDWTVFELGCGVGRVTAQLANHFRHVIAYDVSLSHLEIARTHLAERGIGNVTLGQLKVLDDLANLESVDMFYSIIVLQHNPPPLIYRILDIVLGKIRAGGCAYFQVPVSADNYEFSIQRYLAEMGSGTPKMETHLLPQRHLFQLLSDHGLLMLDCKRDGWQPARYDSISILAANPG